MSFTVNNLNSISPFRHQSPEPDSPNQPKLSRAPSSQPGDNQLTLCGMLSPNSRSSNNTHFHKCHNINCLRQSHSPTSLSFKSEKRVLINDRVAAIQQQPSAAQIKFKFRLDSPDLDIHQRSGWSPFSKDYKSLKGSRSIRAGSVSTLCLSHEQRRASPFTYIETTSIKKPSGSRLEMLRLKRAPLHTETTRHKTVLFTRLGSHDIEDRNRRSPSIYASSVNLYYLNNNNNKDNTTNNNNHQNHVFLIFFC